MNDRALLQQALEALEGVIYRIERDLEHDHEWAVVERELASEAITALRERLAQPNPKPVTALPSSTRYTVEVEGQARTYWDNVHDAITNAQRAVYAGVDATTRAIDDLRSGRIAEWSYGFSAVRIYPPQRVTPPRRELFNMMRGVRVEGDTVIITVKGGNDNARHLCGELLREKEQ